MPMSCAAARERSRTRPRMKGPRSLTRTTTLLPLCLLVTRSRVPKARERWAAVSVEAFIRSPEAVLEWAAYQEAPPQPVAANAAIGLITTDADIVAAMASVRKIIFKTNLPSTLLSAAWWRRGLKSGQKWRKSAIFDHGMLQNEIFVVKPTKRSLVPIPSILEKNKWNQKQIRQLFRDRLPESRDHVISKISFAPMPYSLP